MFNSKSIENPEPSRVDVDPVEQPVPLSELELDLPAPGEGWPAHLAHRGVEIVLDDLGRAAVARGDARRLFTERREAEAKAREHAAAAELQAIERDRQFRASLGRGLPTSMIPAGMSAGEVVASAELDSVGYHPRASLVADVLDNSAGTMVFHSFEPTEE